MGDVSKSIGDKLRAIDEHAQRPGEPDMIPVGQQLAENARNAVVGGGKRNSRSQVRKASGPNVSSTHEND